MDETKNRPLVPTERQAQLGEKETATPAPREVASEEEESAKRMRDFFRDLDPRRVGGPKVPLLLIGLYSLFSGWDDAAFGLLLPEMRAEFAFSLAFLLVLGQVLGIFSALIAPAMGYVADRLKRVWMLRAGALLANAGSIVTGVATGAPQLVAGRAMVGLGTAVHAPASFPLITDYFPSSSRARVFSFLFFMGGIGALLGPPIAGNLAEAFGWRSAVVVLGVIATGIAFAYFFIREPVRGAMDRIEQGAPPEVAGGEQEPVSWGEAWRAAASITTLRRLWYATPFLAVGGQYMGLFLGLYYAQEFALGPRDRGYIAVASGLVGLLGLVVAAPLADRLLARRPGRVMALLGGLLVIFAASVVVLALSRNLLLSVLVGLPFGFGFVAITPALFTLISLVVPPRIRGLGLQTSAPWQLLGGIVVILLAGVTDSLGLRQGLLLFAPPFVIGAIILGTGSSGVERDIRAARAASLAEEESRAAEAAGQAKMLVCRDLDVHYGGVQVLFGVDFDLTAGEVVTLLGTNGAGKSTLLRAIAGTVHASNGAIFLDGRDITHVPPHENAAAGVVLVPGGVAVFPALSIKENLRCAAWLNRKDEKYVDERVREVLELFPVLGERGDQLAETLSGGEQRMLALGQAFLMRPRLLLIDELTMGLAPSIIEDLLAAVRKIHAQGIAVVLVEQSINLALTLSERAVFMERGEVRFDGEVAGLSRHPELVRSVFLGGALSGKEAVAGRRRRGLEERPALLSVEDVSVRFGGMEALRKVGLDLAPGEIVGIIGPNGAGKTTLLDVIAGFLEPQSGRVFLDGADVTRLTPSARARRGMARSFQNAILFSSMPVREAIAVARERVLPARSAVLSALWAPNVRRTERSTTRRVENLVALLGLEAFADKLVGELSTGVRRAVEIACLMAAEPRVLLLDEPSSGLAQAESEELGPLLLRVVKESECGILVIEHDVPLLASISDRFIAMEFGEVIASGSPQQVVSDPRVIDSYLSASADVLARSEGAGARLVRELAREKDGKEG